VGYMRTFWAFVRASFLWLLLLPFALYFGGAASNQAVLIANHDKFPVMVNSQRLASFEQNSGKLVDGMIDDVHCVMTDQTHLNALADIFDFKDAGIYSIGDLMIMSGASSEQSCIFLWIVLALYREKQRLARS